MHLRFLTNLQMFNSLEELSVKASQLKSCFYCYSSLPASQKEHIFNACWGGSHKTGQLICGDCNGSFSIIDSAFSIYTTAIMNAGLFKGERHKSIPTIELEGDYDLVAGGKLKQKKPLIKEETQADGRINTNISFHSKGEAKRWLRDSGDSGAESWLGRALTQEEKDILLSKIQQAEFQSDEPQPQPASAEINLREQYRSAAHTILKCLGLFMPDLVSQDTTKQIRQFARYDEGDWQLFAVKQYFSLATLTVELLGLGVKHNSVEIYFCSQLRMVIGVVTILNRIKRSVVIATDYSGSDKILYVFEDTNGSRKPPRGILAEINSQEFSLPTIGIQHFTSPESKRIDQYFQDEISKLTGFYYPLDANDAELRKELDSLKDKSIKVDAEIIERYRQAFLKFLQNHGRISRKPVNPDKVLSKMSDYGLDVASARNFTDRKCCDADFQSFVIKVLENLANEFVQDSLGSIPLFDTHILCTLSRI